MKQALINLINKWACNHLWNVHYEIAVWDKEASLEMPIETKQTLICEKCGKIKRIIL